MGTRAWPPATVAALSLALPRLRQFRRPCFHPTTAPVGPCQQTTPWTSDYWFDDSFKVSCTEPHTTETVSVHQLTNPTVAEAKEMAGRLQGGGHRLSRGQPRPLGPLGVRGSCRAGRRLPTAPPGCAATRSSPRGTYGSVRSTTGSAADVALDPPPDLWTCLDEHPSKSKQPVVPCDQPHRYEQTGTLVTLTLNLDQYPPPAELEAAAQRQCAHGVPEAGENVGFTKGRNGRIDGAGASCSTRPANRLRH